MRMDTQALTHTTGEGNRLNGRKPSPSRRHERQEKPVLDLTKVTIDGQELHDGMRLLISPYEAHHILEEFTFTEQRSLDAANLRAHILDMKRDRFWSGSQIVFAQLPDNKLYLVDGYHRIYAVIQSGIPIEFQVRIERVANYEKLRDLYCSIDTNLRKRSDAQIARAAGISDALDVPQTVITAALGAVTVIACGLQALPPHKRPAEVVTAYGRKDAVAQWVDEIRAYADIISVASTKLKSRLLVQGVMGPALATLRHQPKKARAFWGGVAENDGLRKGDPRRTLVIALLERSVQGKWGGGLIFAPQAWNAWFEGRQLPAIKSYVASKPYLLGTPFTAEDKKSRTDVA